MEIRITKLEMKEYVAFTCCGDEITALEPYEGTVMCSCGEWFAFEKSDFTLRGEEK